MVKGIVNASCVILVLSVGTLFGMEQDVLRRVAQGGLQAHTVNIGFPHAALHAHAQGEQITINQFNQEHYNARQPFFIQAKGSFFSGLLQSSFDCSHLPGYFAKVFTAAVAQLVLTLAVAKAPQLFNRIFRAQEQEKKKKEMEAQAMLQHLVVENHVLDKIQQLPQQTSEQKKIIQQLRDAHIKRMERYMKDYGLVLPRSC